MFSTSTTLIYAELLSNIRQVSVIASFETPSAPGTKAALSDDRQHLKLIHNDNTVLLTLPAQVAAIPSLEQPVLGSFEISWRLPLASSGSARRNSVADTPSAPWSADKLSPQAEVSCRKCGNILLAASSLQTWKDLPSQNWAEMMDFWHCHKPDIPIWHTKSGGSDDHLRAKGYAANNRFTARKGTGFVDLTYFLFHEDDCCGVKVGGLHFVLWSSAFFLRVSRRRPCQRMLSMVWSPIQMPYIDSVYHAASVVAVLVYPFF